MELGLADTVIVRSAAVANDGLQCTAVYSAAVWHWAAHVDGLLQHLEVLVGALHHRHSVDAYMRPTAYLSTERATGVQLSIAAQLAAHRQQAGESACCASNDGLSPLGAPLPSHALQGT